MNKHEWNFRHAGISAFVGVLLGLLTAGIASVTGNDDPKLDTIAGLLAGLLGTVISMQILLNRDLSSIEQMANDALQVGNRASNIGSVNSNLSKKISKLKDLPSVVADTALAAMHESIRGIDVEFDRYSTYIKGRRLSLHSYARFWSSIVGIQERYARSMIARVTHSSDVDIFYDKHARSLQGLHSSFTRKGKIFRILIDREPVEKNRIQKYLNAMRDMKKINCCYINVFDSEYLLGDHADLEFCLLDGKEKFCAEWKLRNKSEIKAFVLTTNSDRYAQYMGYWDGLIGYMRGYEYGHDGLEEDHRNQLLKSKRDFLSDYDAACSL